MIMSWARDADGPVSWPGPGGTRMADRLLRVVATRQAATWLVRRPRPHLAACGRRSGGGCRLSRRRRALAWRRRSRKVEAAAGGSGGKNGGEASSLLRLQ